MINKTRIQENLSRLERYYQKNRGNIAALFFSKLAILEACGWIEETIDNLIRECAKNHLLEKTNLDSVEDLIKNTHSFNYNTHFRVLLSRVIGIINVERLEKSLDSKKFTRMVSTLGVLKQRRDDQAHTHIQGTTTIIDAPSITINNFSFVYLGLKDIEKNIRKMKL